jgi:hypothetical protein
MCVFGRWNCPHWLGSPPEIRHFFPA